MFNRPRCRDWTPLATQQLRLRNLIKITGHNIVCKTKCQLYFTLHSTAMSAPFYTSEKADSHGSPTVDWLELNSQLILKSTLNCVCVRIWEHIPTSEECTARARNDELLRARRESASPPVSSAFDKMLFVWGVYFSGLIYLTKRSEAKFKDNSLSFQMHGGYFASPSSLTAETMRQQLTLNYKLDQKVLSSAASSPANSLKNSSVGSSAEQRVSRGAAPKSCDIFSNLSSSDVVSSKTPPHPTNKSPAGTTDFQINSPRGSRSCSPVRTTAVDDRPSYPLQIDVSRDLLSMLKIRYSDKNFRTSETRPSYNLNKLLRLQELQRMSMQKTEHSKEIVEKICMKSAFCLNLDLITNKGFIYRPRGNPSMGRTLNRLLFQQTQVKPEDILKAQDLKRQIETARFRCRLLAEERDRYQSRIDQIEKKLSQLHDSNIEMGSWLMSRYRNLGREKEALVQEKIAFEGRKEVAPVVEKALHFRRLQLCRELKDIYPIRRRTNGNYDISNVMLPSAGDANWVNSADYIRETVSPLSYSVALGYVAHLVQMCSVILNLPLRNPIKHEGSRSRIIDVVKEIPNAPREFPLYSRTNPPPNIVLYAVYLLNQNIAQLNFQVNNIKCDIRATLPNLLTLLNGPSTYLDLPVLSTINGTNPYKPINNFASASGSSIDLNVPVPPHISDPVDVIDNKINDQRISRSVGSSYSDEQLSSNGKNFHSSEPILSIQQVHLTNFSENGNI